jgi:tyrosinase
MADRFVSDPLEIPRRPDGRDYDHADLEFYGVDHSGLSFEARVFLNNRDATDDTPLELEAGYAGSFHIFGHGGCFGDVGHCDVPTEPPDPFDLRLPHPLFPATKSIEVTDVLKTLRDSGAEDVTVTVVAVPYEAAGPLGRDAAAELTIESISLVTYETELLPG